MNREHRKGAEFSFATKQRAAVRAKGRCENPIGCDSPNNGRVDHLTSCYLGSLIGMSKLALRSLDNAQLLCDVCDHFKTTVLEPEAIYRESQRLRFLPSWLHYQQRRVA